MILSNTLKNYPQLALVYNFNFPFLIRDRSNKNYGKAKNILIVEEKEIAEMYEIMLGNKGYNTHTVSDVETAFYILKNEKIDLILLDLLSPNIHAHQLLSKIKKIPIIGLSDFQNYSKNDKAYELGVSELILKLKSTPNELLNIIKKVLYDKGGIVKNDKKIYSPRK